MGGEAATIEHAVSALKVKEIVICGHSHCGAMAGLLDLGQVEQMPAVKSCFQHAESTRRIVNENYSHLTEPDKRLTLTVEENVLVQLEALKTHPSVAAAIGRGDLKLHGWIYVFEIGKVFAFDPGQNQFLPIEQCSPTTPHPTRR